VSGKLIRSAGFASVVLLLSVACGGTSSNKATSTPAATNSLSAYSAEKASLPPTSQPSPTPLIAGPDVRLCHRTDITTAVSDNAATGGQLLGAIVLGNRSDTPCQIKQPPQVELLDVHSEVLPITVTPGKPCPETPFCIFQQPVLLLPGLGDPQSHVAVKPGQVVLTLTWHIHNGAGTCPTPPPKATEVRLLLQDTEDEVVVDVTSVFSGGIAPCDGTVQIFGYGPGTAE
jgi:hypothetical protein